MAVLRRTAGRVAILKILLRTKKPLTQEQIASRLADSNLNKTTVYRCLERFIETGLVHRAFLQNRTWHFELGHRCSELQCHPHFTCNNCGSTHCMTDVSMPMAKALPAGFVIHRQCVQLDGICPGCSKEKTG